MLRALPRFSEQFGLSPAEFWSLEQDEFEVYMKAIRQSDQEAEEAQAKYG